MKRILRHFVIDSVSIFLVSSIASGMVFEKGIETLLLTGLGLPIINILLLPVNLITFGLFRWVAAVAVLYIVTMVVPGFKIVSFDFGGYTSLWIDLPVIAFAGFLAVVAFSFLHSIISSFIYWLIK